MAYRSACSVVQIPLSQILLVLHFEKRMVAISIANVENSYCKESPVPRTAKEFTYIARCPRSFSAVIITQLWCLGRMLSFYKRPLSTRSLPLIFEDINPPRGPFLHELDSRQLTISVSSSSSRSSNALSS